MSPLYYIVICSTTHKFIQICMTAQRNIVLGLSTGHNQSVTDAKLAKRNDIYLTRFPIEKALVWRVGSYLYVLTLTLTTTTIFIERRVLFLLYVKEILFESTLFSSEKRSAPRIYSDHSLQEDSTWPPGEESASVLRRLKPQGANLCNPYHAGRKFGSHPNITASGSSTSQSLQMD